MENGGLTVIVDFATVAFEPALRLLEMAMVKEGGKDTVGLVLACRWSILLFGQV
jgi:hypothetical protein